MIVEIPVFVGMDETCVGELRATFVGNYGVCLVSARRVSGVYCYVTSDVLLAVCVWACHTLNV